MRLGLDGALLREEVVLDVHVEHGHVGLIVVALGEDGRHVARKLEGLDVDAAEVARHGLEDVQVVRGGVPLEHVEQQLAADDKAVQEHALAELDAVVDALHAAVLHVKADGVVKGAAGGARDHGHVGAGLLVSGVDLVKVNVVDEVCRGQDDRIGSAASEEDLVMHKVAQQEAGAGARSAKGASGQDEEAAVLAVQVPVLAGAHVVDERAVVVGHDHADGADAAVDQVGERKVNEAVATEERHGRHGAARGERAGLLGRVVAGDEANDLLHC